MTERARVAVVTGAASGIGAATTQQLLEDGFQVAAVDLGPPESPVGHEPHLTVQADVGDEDQVEAAFASVHDAFGHVDVLVNNAGVTGSRQATVCHETSLSDWEHVMGVNVRGVFLCTRAALPNMLRRKSGHIITLASIAGIVAFPGRCAYTTSKGAALMFTKSLAVDYAGQGVRANAVCPGMVATPMTRWRLDVPELREAVERNIPLGRVATPEEVADCVSVLAGDRLAYLNGHALALDGGWTAL